MWNAVPFLDGIVKHQKGQSATHLQLQTWSVQLKAVDLQICVFPPRLQSARITCVNSWPFLLNCYTLKPEDAQQKICALQSTVCGLNGNGRTQIGFDTFFFFLQPGVYKLQRSVFEIFDFKLNNRLEPLHSEPASREKNDSFCQNNGQNLQLSDWITSSKI